MQFETTHLSLKGYDDGSLNLYWSHILYLIKNAWYRYKHNIYGMAPWYLLSKIFTRCRLQCSHHHPHPPTTPITTPLQCGYCSLISCVNSSVNLPVTRDSPPDLNLGPNAPGPESGPKRICWCGISIDSSKTCIPSRQKHSQISQGLQALSGFTSHIIIVLCRFRGVSLVPPKCIFDGDIYLHI